MANLKDFSDKNKAREANTDNDTATVDDAVDNTSTGTVDGTVDDNVDAQQGQTVFQDTAQAPYEEAATTSSDKSSVNYTKQCTIADTQTPILVLFGPSQCGKSMTLVRLARYLRNVLSYNIEPRRDFLPSDNLVYQQRCDAFENTINTYAPLPGNEYDEYMLCTVSDQHGNSKFQILEGPGEHYFSPIKPNSAIQPYPFYFNQIKNSRTPKTWCFFLEPDWLGRKLTPQYVSRIKRTLAFINVQRDRIVFLYNKVDKTEFIKFGKVNFKALTRFAAQQYPGLFEAFKEDRLFFKWFKPYLFEFVPFSTGDFSEGTFVESPDHFPAALLKVIKMR